MNEFQQILDLNKRELDKAKKYEKLNSSLKSHDWLIVCPLFFVNGELDFFIENPSLEKSKILDIIKNVFYNLDRTSIYVEGYFEKISYIKPFSKSIENSIILAFQKEYEGSIKTLIPIIEGVIRKYLSTKNKTKISFYDIKGYINCLKEDLESNLENNISNTYKFENSELNEILSLQKEYYKIWFSFIDDYLKENFYLKTDNGKEITNHINRHSIIHEFGNDFNYNFESFIKVFFIILFMAWCFMIVEGIPLIIDVDNNHNLYKIISYKNIIEISEEMDYDKHVLLNGKRGYKEENLHTKFSPILNLKKRTIICLQQSQKESKNIW